MSFSAKSRTAAFVLASLGCAAATGAAQADPYQARSPTLQRVQLVQQMPRPQPNAGVATDDGASKQFVCQDGSRLSLDFGQADHGVAAMVSVHGDAYRLPALPVKPGPVRLEWSDGVHSLTWSPGVRLMWMSGSTHLMCGRGGHNH